MSDTLLPKLEASRKELLDLGMRNSLLNYKIPQGRGLHIVLEKSSAIYNLLVYSIKTTQIYAKIVDRKIRSMENILY